LQALAEGPRAAGEFAAVISSLLVMVAAIAGVQELLAHSLQALARRLDASRAADDSIASTNIVKVIGQLYMYKGIGARDGSFWPRLTLSWSVTVQP
jgi:hypothetical protein